MAGESGQQVDRLKSIIDLVQKEGAGHFRAMVVFLERALNAGARVGFDGPVAAEGIRFRHDPSLSFATSDVTSVELIDAPHPPHEASDRRIVEIVTSFLGLTGAVTPLPTYLAEEVAQEPATEPVLRDFYDIFHHRFISLMFRAIVRYSYPVTFSRQGGDPWTRRLLALASIDTYDHPYATTLPIWRLLRLSPLLNVRRPTHWVLETALRDTLQVALEGAPLRLEQFVGSWVPLDVSEQTKLALSCSRLGVDFVIGTSAFDRAGRFRIVVGPCARTVYYRFRRDLGVHQTIVDTVRLFCRDPLDYDLGLILDANQFDGMALSIHSEQRLGVDSFLSSQSNCEVTVPILVPSVPSGRKPTSATNQA